MRGVVRSRTPRLARVWRIERAEREHDNNDSPAGYDRGYIPYERYTIQACVVRGPAEP